VRHPLQADGSPVRRSEGAEPGKAAGVRSAHPSACAPSAPLACNSLRAGTARALTAARRVTPLSAALLARLSPGLTRA